MPSHVINFFEFNCSPERFLEVAESLKSDPKEPLGQVDFNKLIPMPESLDIESSCRGEKGYAAYKEFLLLSMPLDDAEKDKLEASFRDRFKDDPETWELGKQYHTNMALYGASTWYDWCYTHWDTKWNAYACEPVTPSDRRLVFQTAWSSVPRIAKAISRKAPEVAIRYRWTNESIEDNVGDVTLLDGAFIEDNSPEECSREAYELAADVLGLDLGEIGYVLSEDGTTYEYKDQNEDLVQPKEEATEMLKYYKMDIRFRTNLEERAIRHFLLRHAFDAVAKDGMYSVYVPTTINGIEDPVEDFRRETRGFTLVDVKDADITCAYDNVTVWFTTPLGTKFTIGRLQAEYDNFDPDEYAIGHYGESAYPLDLGMLLQDGKRAKAAMAHMLKIL